jgi:hypothetical protein
MVFTVRVCYVSLYYAWMLMRMKVTQIVTQSVHV